ncbi:MAG: cytochrome c [Burkholderiales bacterium]|nr:cytochrome c [Burkholderiales bacterium]
MKKILVSLVVAGASLMGVSAQAQFAKPEDAIKYRKAAFTLLAAHNGRLGAMAQGRVPFDAKSALDNAEIVADVAKLPWAAFVDGTDSGETKAKAEIWKDNAKFKDYAGKLQAESVKLVAAAKSGNQDAFKTAFGATAGACKACHDDFRAK